MVVLFLLVVLKLAEENSSKAEAVTWPIASRTRLVAIGWPFWSVCTFWTCGAVEHGWWVWTSRKRSWGKLERAVTEDGPPAGFFWKSTALPLDETVLSTPLGSPWIQSSPT